MAIQEAEARRSGAKDYFRPRRFGHANLYIGELERSMDFYKNVIGLREAYRRPPIQAGFLNNGNTHHDIGMISVKSKSARSTKTGLNHLAWELETQVDLVEGYRRSIADGIRYDMTIDHEISHSVYNKDPDGNLNEIYADTGMRWYKDRHGDVMKPTLHWTPGDIPPSNKIHYEPNPEIVRVENAVFHPKKITQAVLAVADFAGAYDYYTGNVGLRPVIGGRDAPFVVLGGTLGLRDLGLFRAKPNRPAGLHHISFVVWDEKDLEASIARAKKERITIVTEVDQPSRRGVVIADPDGIRVLFYVDRPAKLPNLAAMDVEQAIYLV